MKTKLSLLFILSLLLNVSKAQYFEWVHNNPSSYSFNPDMVGAPLCILSAGGEVNARLDSFVVHYNQDAFGTIIIEKRDASGNMQWNFLLSKKAFVKRITSDSNGNIYLCGSFMDTLSIKGLPALFNTGTGFNTDFYLIKIDSNGNLIWSRNLSLSHSQFYLEDLQLDQNENCWYAVNDFNNSTLYQVDNSGIDVDSLVQDGLKIISSFCFDSRGNILLAGATDNGTVSFGNQSYTAPYSYNKFIGRYNSNRQASWAYFAYDITFMQPKIVCDKDGNAFTGGTIYDSTSFGNLHFDEPQWSMEFYLLKIDSSGIFQWGKSNPAGSSPITGRFHFSSDDAMATDSTGNLYIAGTSAGVLNWGNGVVMTAGNGQLFENLLSVLSFDGSGNIRWGKIFGSTSYNSLHTLRATPSGDCYFNAGFRDTSNFDSISIAGSGLMNFAIGKISVSNLTGISNQEVNELFLYPNPSNGAIQLKGLQEDASLRIIDTGGRIVFDKKIRAGQTIEASTIADGLYFVQLIQNERTGTFRWLKQSE